MRNAVSRLFVAIIACGATGPAFSLTTGLDSRFGTGGVVLLGPTTSGDIVDEIWELQIEDDGRIVVAGRAIRSGAILPAIGRLNSDGSWDASFGNSGLFVLPYDAPAAPKGGDLHEVAVLSDHSILAAGNVFFDALQFKTCTLMVKLTSSGVLDATFSADKSGSFCYDFAPGTSTAPYGFYHTGLLVDSSDTIYLTSRYTNLSHGAVAHFDSHGTLMAGYGSDGVAALPEGMFSHLLQLTSENQILVVGNTDTQVEVVRLDQTGAIDTNYATGGGILFDAQPAGSSWPIHAALDTHQRLLVAINAYSNGQNLPYRFARLTSSGVLDNTFNGDNQQPGYPGLAMPTVSAQPADFLIALLPLPDGHSIAIGQSGLFPVDGATNAAVLRLNGDSGYDATYGDAGHAGWSAIEIGSNGISSTIPQTVAANVSGHAVIAIHVADGAGAYCTGLIRMITDRLLDSSFEAPAPMPTCPQ